MKIKGFLLLFALLMIIQINFTNASTMKKQNLNTTATTTTLENQTVIMQNTTFYPYSFSVTVNEIVNITIINKDAFSHTFTITNTSSQRISAEYTVKGAPPVDYVVNGNSSIHFIYQFPSTNQTIEFYCRFHSIMYGFIYVKLPSQNTVSSQNAGSSQSITSSQNTISSQNTVSSKNTSTSFNEASFLVAIFGISLIVAFKRKTKQH